MSIRWTEEEFAIYNAKIKAEVNPAVSPADVESNPKHGSPAKNVDKEIHSRFRIHVHSRRRRLCDPDGVCAKAAIDGLVAGGLLADDSAKYIDSVTFSQEKSDVEETIIEIESIEKGF